MPYSQSTVNIPDKDKNAVLVALASGPGITTGNAPLHADPGIGPIDAPVATNATGDWSTNSLQKGLLSERLLASLPRTTRRCFVPPQVNGLPTSSEPSAILSDGGTWAGSGGTATPVRLRSLAGVSLQRTTTTTDYYGGTTSTVSPALESYLLIVASTAGVLGPVGPGSLGSVSYDSATYRIAFPAIQLPGSITGLPSNTTGAPFGTRFVGYGPDLFGEYGLLFPAGFTILVSSRPDAYVATNGYFVQANTTVA
jgi:hypothetical protein